jgi:tRNA G46 methylase TrmB
MLDIQHAIQIVGYKNPNNSMNMQEVSNKYKNNNIKIINMMGIKLFNYCIKDKKLSKIIIKAIKRKY